MRRIGPPSVASFKVLLTRDSRISPLFTWTRPSPEIRSELIAFLLGLSTKPSCRSSYALVMCAAGAAAGHGAWRLSIACDLLRCSLLLAHWWPSPYKVE